MSIKPSERDKSILKFYRKIKNMSTVAREFGLTRERVRQIIHKYGEVIDKKGMQGARLETRLKNKAEKARKKLPRMLRNRFRIALKKNLKHSSSIVLLGCSLDDFRFYMEGKFQDGMTWENHGKWHIDHIKPCSSFDLSDPKQQEICFHYSNLQPLWAHDNQVKHNKLSTG
jgi:hypothetical protein